MEARELIERYVYQVGQQLPRKMQADVQLELRSLLHDTLEERAVASGRTPIDKLAADIVREFGKPEDMAAQYRPARHLIGPKQFPHFVFAIRLVCAVFLGMYLVLFSIPFLSEKIDHNVMLYAWRLLVDLADNLLFCAGLILAIFAAIECFTDPAKREEPSTRSTWDPLALPKAVEESLQIKRGQYALSIVWTTLLIVLFNLYPGKIGYLSASGEGAVVVPLLAQDFFVHVPWISAYWIMLISLKLSVLRKGRWTQPTRWMEIEFGLFGLYVLYRIANGGPILTVDALTVIVRLLLRIALVIAVVDLVAKLYRLLFKWPSQPLSSD